MCHTSDAVSTQWELRQIRNGWNPEQIEMAYNVKLRSTGIEKIRKGLILENVKRLVKKRKYHLGVVCSVPNENLLDLVFVP